MGLPVLGVDIVAVVGGCQGDIQLSGKAEDPLVHLALHGDPVILELQEIISPSKDLLVF